MSDKPGPVRLIPHSPAAQAAPCRKADKSGVMLAQVCVAERTVAAGEGA